MSSVLPDSKSQCITQVVMSGQALNVHMLHFPWWTSVFKAWLESPRSLWSTINSKCTGITEIGAIWKQGIGHDNNEDFEMKNP